MDASRDCDRKISSDESEMLTRFAEIVSRNDPDLTTGYNSSSVDNLFKYHMGFDALYPSIM